MSELKPGDRALVLRCWKNDDHALSVLGTICEVRSSPYFDADSNRPAVRVTVRYHTGVQCGHRCEWLLRLPPDDEAKRLFRETEKPREVSHV